MLQPKDTGLLNGYKNKTHIYAVYKRPTSDLGTYRLKVRGWKKIFHAKGNQKKALKMAIKPQEKRTKEEGKKKDLQKQTQNN